MTARLLTTAWLTLVWVLLWGTPSVANVAAGLVLATVLVTLFPVAHDGGGGIHPVALLRYGLVFSWALVVATASVVRTVVSRRMPLEQGVVEVPMHTRSPLVTAFVANSISLTPGTLTIDVRPRSFGFDDHDAAPVLFVHCLVVGDPERIRADVHRLERLAVDAFGTVADRGSPTAPRPGGERP